jgi:hypothetical protein
MEEVQGFFYTHKYFMYKRYVQKILQYLSLCYTDSPIPAYSIKEIGRYEAYELLAPGSIPSCPCWLLICILEVCAKIKTAPCRLRKAAAHLKSPKI